MSNPYRGLAGHQFWRQGVSNLETFAINPATEPRFQLNFTDKVATAGSCFAQHISREISNSGFNFYCPETNPDLSQAELKFQQYEVFSARYGNIYTIHQLNQLFEEAVNGADKHEKYWKKGGSFYDPYRPTVFSNGFNSSKELLKERATHLAYVRDVFQKCDVFVFTLGLTEAWRSKVDGSVFPLAPGVVAGDFNPEVQEFHNFSIDEVRSELFLFIESLKKINPKVRVLLTVSPVPLIATYELRHVLTSTTYSKSVLRVAAQEAYEFFPFVDYFPSFEIITGSPTGGLYYEDDKREVNRLGVAHAMRCFLNAYTSKGKETARVKITSEELDDFDEIADIICDEEEIERSIRRVSDGD